MYRQPIIKMSHYILINTHIDKVHGDQKVQNLKKALTQSKRCGSHNRPRGKKTSF